MTRIAILGGPRTGKTTFATKLAKKLGLLVHSTGKRSEDPVVHTDSFIKLGWDEIPDHVIAKLELEPDFILEGCQAARVLRRWFKQDPTAPKLDRVYVFTQAKMRRSAAHDAMAKGISSIITGLLPQLREAGVIVTTDPENP